MKHVPRIALGMLLLPQLATAGDVADAPLTVVDPAADISSLYAWHTSNNTLVTVLTFAALSPAGSTGTYDPNVLYGVHLDNNADNLPDVDIYFQVGQNGNGDWGVRATYGTTEIIGPVQTVITQGNDMLWAGPADDPFFMDFGGWQDTVATGALSFNPSSDTFAGTNVTAFVFETDLTAALDGGDVVRVWATTGRKP